MRTIRLVFLLLLSIGAPAAVHAGVILGSGTTSYDGYTFAVTACSYKLNNAAATGCTNTNVELEVTASRGELTLTYLNVENASGPLLSQASASGCTCISLSLTITSSNGISAVQVSDTGVDKINNALDDWVAVGSSSSPVAQAYIDQGGTSASGSYTLPSTTTSLNLNMNLGLNGAYQPGVLSLNTASVTLTTIPEPAAVSVFLIGVGGLALLRSRRRRSVRMDRRPLGRARPGDDPMARASPRCLL